MIHRLAIAGAAILFSTGGAAVKLSSMSGWQVASLRSLLAAVVLAVLLKQARSGFSRRSWLVGVAYAATMILFVLANKLTTAANATFLQSSSPLYILALSPWLLAERARRSDYLLMGVLAVGLSLFFIEMRAGSGSAPQPRLGNILGALSGISYAFMLMGLRWMERAEPDGTARDAAHGGEPDAASGEPDKRPQNAALTAVVAGNLLASLFAAPMAFPVSGSALDWGVIGYLGVIQIGLAYILLTYGLRHVPAFEGSLIILLEPSLSPLWAWLLHGEIPGTLAIAGGVLIVGATTFKGWLDERARRRALNP